MKYRILLLESGSLSDSVPGDHVLDGSCLSASHEMYARKLGRQSRKGQQKESRVGIFVNIATTIA